MYGSPQGLNVTKNHKQCDKVSNGKVTKQISISLSNPNNTRKIIKYQVIKYNNCIVGRQYGMQHMDYDMTTNITLTYHVR
jgi:hypothetical protein